MDSNTEMQVGDCLEACIDDLQVISSRLNLLCGHVEMEEFICTLHLYEAFSRQLIEIQRRLATQSGDVAVASSNRH